MLQRLWDLIRGSVEGYIADDAMSRGAAIAYYSFFSVAPLLVIAIAIAGIFFGPQAVQGAVSHQLRELMGDTGAQVVEGLIRSAADQQSGRIAAVIGIVVLLVTASSVFTEVQTALNVIWRAPAARTRHLDPPAAEQAGQRRAGARHRAAAAGLAGRHGGDGGGDVLGDRAGAARPATSSA